MSKLNCSQWSSWVFSVVIGGALGLCLTPPCLRAGALENYVNAPDPKFSWKKIDQTKPMGYTVTHLEMTSQKWREHLWTHHLQVVRPERVRNPGIALLFITGDGEGKNSIRMLQLLADRAGAVAAVVTDVPNQPLYGGKTEDELVAYTFAQYLKTGDETWPVLFPMTKTAVRAMDAVTALVKQENNETVEGFVVSGISKRGWTTWLTAAVDPRVKAIAPQVIDMLNMKKQIEWAQKVYGRQSEKIQDYTDLNLHLMMDAPRNANLRGWVDPYSYRNRYTMPKLLLLGTNDRYWTVDSLRHYWDDLPGPKLIFQTPNAGHDLGDRKDSIQTLAAFFEMIADGKELPKMGWTFKGGEKPGLELTVEPPAESMRLFTSTSRDRDFRDDIWSNRVLQSQQSNRATGFVTVPASGYLAFMGEVTLKSPRGHPYKLSTQVRVEPDNIK